MKNGEKTNVYERLFKLWGMVCQLVMSGARDAQVVVDSLQTIVDEPMVQKTKEKSYYVNLAANPITPNDWKMKTHKRGGKRVKVELRDGELYLGEKKVILYFSEQQQNGKTIQGFALKEELSGKPVINANLLDFLLKHTELIPESWKNKVVFFWGTEYEDSAGYLYVRYLFCSGSRWDWGADWLEVLWLGHFPAALAAT